MVSLAWLAHTSKLAESSHGRPQKLRIVLDEKSQLNLNEKDVFTQTFQRGISNKPRSFILCEEACTSVV